jgi:hypothetical protein
VTLKSHECITSRHLHIIVGGFPFYLFATIIHIFIHSGLSLSASSKYNKNSKYPSCFVPLLTTSDYVFLLLGEQINTLTKKRHCTVCVMMMNSVFPLLVKTDESAVAILCTVRGETFSRVTNCLSTIIWTGRELNKLWNERRKYSIETS